MSEERSPYPPVVRSATERTLDDLRKELKDRIDTQASLNAQMMRNGFQIAVLRTAIHIKEH